MDLKDAKERFEKVKQEYFTQFKSLKQTIVSMKNQMTHDDEKRL
jgi:flagellar capping protein FliD